MPTATYSTRRGQLETYFDRTAVDAWARLTSDAPVSGIRATVRAGRDAMRATLLDWLPADLRGARLLDAGCGTGALAVEAARRGARGASRSTVADAGRPGARARCRATSAPAASTFAVGDMLDAALGRFDHVVAMDSLIHYRAPTSVRVLARLAARTGARSCSRSRRARRCWRSMHAVGRLFPRGDRAPAIEPVARRRSLRAPAAASPRWRGWRIGRTPRGSRSGFYIVAGAGAGAAMNCAGADIVARGMEQHRHRGSCRSPMRRRRNCRCGGCCGCRCSRSRSAWRWCC